LLVYVVFLLAHSVRLQVHQFLRFCGSLVLQFCWFSVRLPLLCHGSFTCYGWFSAVLVWHDQLLPFWSSLVHTTVLPVQFGLHFTA
jgi:hypothetical protein